MIDQALYIAIGFLAASLIAVALAPVVSRRAVRLFSSRAKVLGSSSAEAAVVERDALRAAHAMRVVRLERQLVVAEEQTAALRAELGRNAIRLLGLQSQAAERAEALTHWTTEADRLSSESRELEAALSASRIALHDLSEQRDRAVAAEQAGRSRVNELEAQASRDRARIAILAARSEHMEGRVADLTRANALEKAAFEKTLAESKVASSAQRGKVGDLEDRLRAEITRSDQALRRAAAAEAAVHEFRQKVAELETRHATRQRAQEEELITKARQLGAVAAEAPKAPQAAIRELDLSGARTRPPEERTLHDEVGSLRSKVMEGLSDQELRASLRRLGRDVALRYDGHRSVKATPAKNSDLAGARLARRP